MQFKKLSKSLAIFIIGFLFGFFTYKILFIYKQHTQLVNIYNLYALIEKVSNPIMAIASVMNLLIIITFYLYDKKTRKIEQNIDREGFWYRSIIIEKNINSIDEYYNNALEKLRKISKIEENNINKDQLKEIISEFKSSKTRLLRSLNDLIRVLNTKLADVLDDLIFDFEDEFIEGLIIIYNSYFIKNKDDKVIRELENKCNNFRLNYLSKVYRFDLNCYRNDKFE